MLESDIPNYCIRLLASLGPFLIACLVAYIAYRQWLTARDKLRLDLFDRRYAIYKRVIDALNLSQTNPADNKTSFSATIELHRLREESLFLFGEEIIESINELNSAISKERYHYKKLEAEERGSPELEKHAAEIERIGNSYSELIKKFTTQCMPYMAFGEKSSEPWKRKKP